MRCGCRAFEHGHEPTYPRPLPGEEHRSNASTFLDHRRRATGKGVSCFSHGFTLEENGGLAAACARGAVRSVCRVDVLSGQIWRNVALLDLCRQDGGGGVVDLAGATIHLGNEVDVQL